MNGELAVLDILLDDPTVTEMVATRVYLEEAPQTATYPYIIIELADNEPFDSKSGKSTVDHNRINVYSYAPTYKAMKNLSNACRNALDHVSGTYNSVVVADIRYQNETSFDEEIENVKLFVRDQEYLVRVKLT